MVRMVWFSEDNDIVAFKFKSSSLLATTVAKEWQFHVAPRSLNGRKKQLWMFQRKKKIPPHFKFSSDGLRNELDGHPWRARLALSMI